MLPVAPSAGRAGCLSLACPSVSLQRLPLTFPALPAPACCPFLQEWAKDVLRHYNKYKNEDKRKYAEMDAEEIQSKFVEAVHDHPLYGTNFFHVRRHKFPEQVRGPGCWAERWRA